MGSCALGDIDALSSWISKNREGYRQRILTPWTHWITDNLLVPSMNDKKDF
jgi:hypothetical protein